MNWQNAKKIHFIGIGGIGVSAVARLMLELKKDVTGSDLVKSGITEQLSSLGAKIRIGTHKPGNLPEKTDIVVHTNATLNSNTELKKAKKEKILILSYPEFLRELMVNYLPIIVAGTHGKSTTTAMLAKIFMAAGLDPTVVVGTQLKELRGNARLGLGRHFIAEGDEYRAAFLHYQPIGLIVTSLEADHLDYYKNIDNLKKAFKKLVETVPSGGFLVANINDENVIQVRKNAKCRVLTYGLEYGDYYATHIVQHGELTRFAVKGLERFDLALRVPGRHNVMNALAAAVMALCFGIKHEIIQKALLDFTGVWRRFEIKGEKNGIIIIDDYAHHPTEIKATLLAARQFFPKRRLWCVFQPHSRNRTRTLLKEFANSFDNCDQLILTDIYQVAGREKNEKIKIEDLYQAIVKNKKEITLVKDLNKIKRLLHKKLLKGDVVITMGAGTITKVSDELVN